MKKYYCIYFGKDEAIAFDSLSRAMEFIKDLLKEGIQFFVSYTCQD